MKSDMPRKFAQQRKIPILCWGLMLLAWTLGCSKPSPPPLVPPISPIDPIQQISTLLQQGNLVEAERVVLARIALEPENPTYLAVAGEIAFMGERWKVAAERFVAASKTRSGPAVVPLLHRAARAATQCGRYFLATEQLDRIIRESPEDANAHREIAGVQCSIGLEWESIDHLHWLLRNFKGPPTELSGTLLVLADRGRPQCDPAWIRAGLKHVPEDLRPSVGTARIEAFESQWAEVRTTCEKILEKHQSFLPAWVLYGRALWETRDVVKFKNWISTPPSGAAQHPDYWLAVGRASAEEGDSTGAARALWESLRLDPTLRESARALVPILGELGQSELGDEVAEYARNLEDVVSRVDHFVGWKNQSQTGAVEIAERMFKLGRFLEADRWARLAAMVSSDPCARTMHVFQLCTQPLRAGTPIVADDKHPQRWERVIAKYDLPKLDFMNTRPKPISDGEFDGRSQIVLADEAQARGLNFRFINGDDPQAPGIWIHESNGNGAAILDFDLNGFPDVCIPQAGGKPLTDGSSQPSRLYRNRSGTFDDATRHLFPGNRNYGQGAGIGDLDDDGFSDLVIGNIGSDCLYRNNGDGTFSDLTPTTGVHGKRWTSSVVLADLDGDQICDFLEVGYCAGTEPFSVACYSENNKYIMACSPNAFPPEPARFWKGQGDGTFIDHTTRVLATTFPGRGLGVVVTDFDTEPGLEIFVANDMNANHFWIAKRTDGEVVFQDQAALRGVATDARGTPQACMGIAAGDADHDGDIDMVVTNFADEANNFFQQAGNGKFSDRAAASGLAEPSRPMLGYGCQFADFDGDGTTELLVANGHVQDAAANAEHAMYAQMFSYRDGWHELDRTLLGPYFALRHMGRGMALLDVQADGWPDAMITDVVAPVALLVNHSQHTRRPLVFELVARSTCRDAIGARIETIVDGQTEVRWVTAGDGFQSSNERKLWFAIPAASQTDLKISWPSGQTQSLLGIAPGSYLVVENTEPVPRNKLKN